MPRSAAAILGLTLVAFSIGFNTVRYPMVWEMIGPARASEKDLFFRATTAGSTRPVGHQAPAATEGSAAAQGRAHRREAGARGGQEARGETASARR